MRGKRTQGDQPDGPDADQAKADSDRHLSSRDLRGSERDQGLSSLDQRLSNMEQASADRTYQALVDPTRAEDREYAVTKRQRQFVTSLRLENGATRARIGRERQQTAHERDEARDAGVDT